VCHFISIDIEWPSKTARSPNPIKNNLARDHHHGQGSDARIDFFSPANDA
jgi:hypothetical protein